MHRLLAASLGALVVALPAHAQTTNETTDVAEVIGVGEPATDTTAAPFTISGGVTLASQYRFRGISLSDEDFAVQGTINLNHESGAYAGVWASSLGGVGGVGGIGGADAEVDLYAGYRTGVASGVTLDAGLLYYAYPGSEGGNSGFFEPYANVSGTLGPATAKVGVAYGWEQDGLGGNSNVYTFGDLTAGIPNTPVTLRTHLGYSKGDTPLTPGGDYVDWLVGADVVYKSLTFGVAYVDTDLTGAQAFRGRATKDIVDGALVFSLTAAF